MSNPAISIGLPFFNAQATLASAVQSIREQSFTGWELLLLDDGSTDASLEIARSFNDPRIRVVSDGKNQGIAARLNQAVALARGKYFFRMDGDDLAFPERLQKQFDFLELHAEVDLVASNAIYFKSAEEILGTLNVGTTHEAIAGRPWAGFYMPHPSWGGRRAWFLANPYDGSHNGAEDQELLYRTHGRSRFACLPEPLLGYREVSRDLGKRFGRRKILARAMIRSARQQGRWFDILCVLMLFVAKSGADFANLKLGLPGLRTKFLPATPEQESQLRHMLTASGARE